MRYYEIACRAITNRDYACETMNKHKKPEGQFTELAEAANMTNGCSPNSLSASEKHKIARQFVDRIAEMNAKMAIAADVKEMKARPPSQRITSLCNSPIS